MGHSTFLYPKFIPFLLYTHYDSYYVVGEGIKKLWGPFSINNREVISVGPVRDYLILDSISNKEIKTIFN